ncbi:MAG TPA: ISLre2 family transposase [Clostridiales bacterium]|nr:ISLre2 family transposase [Clostridiales bacterium]
MMNTIVTEKMMPFKELEKKVFDSVCEMGRILIKTILESYDEQLQETRNKKELRCKGTRQTTIKTVMGEVGYSRNVYQTMDEAGHKAWVYLLDQELQMDKIGFFSTNLAEKIAKVVTDNSYHTTAEIISSTCGQSISHGGAWRLVQRIGERISGEETARVKEMDATGGKGTKELKLLFEEMDGVWLKMQGKGHKKAPKQEMKVATIYEGWEDDGGSCSRLLGKTLVAGMERSGEFHAKREARIRSIYNADEIGVRVLNGDGGSWIKDPYEPETVFQLDRFHIRQCIKKKIVPQDVQKQIGQLFEEGRYDEMFEYIGIYADSVESSDEKDNNGKKARELYEYLDNNREGLVPWQKQRNDYPGAPEGMVYKNMGVQENQNCTTITLRMKEGRRRWSRNGANNMAKLLTCRENKELVETIGRYTDGTIMAEPVQEILRTLSAAKAPKKDGKGNAYIDLVNHHMPMLNAMQTNARKVFRKAFAV